MYKSHTGKPKWQQALPGHLLKIAVSNGIVYAVDGLDVLALRGSDGTSSWNVTLSDVTQAPSNGFTRGGGQPVVADGHVYISIVDGVDGDEHAQVVALRASDGARVWSHVSDSGAGAWR